MLFLFYQNLSLVVSAKTKRIKIIIGDPTHPAIKLCEVDPVRISRIATKKKSWMKFLDITG